MAKKVGSAPNPELVKQYMEGTSGTTEGMATNQIRMKLLSPVNKDDEHNAALKLLETEAYKHALDERTDDFPHPPAHLCTADKQYITTEWLESMREKHEDIAALFDEIIRVLSSEELPSSDEEEEDDGDEESDDESDDEADQAPTVVDLSSEGDDSDEENEQGSPKRRRK